MTAGVPAALAFVAGVLVGTLTERVRRECRRWQNWYKSPSQGA